MVSEWTENHDLGDPQMKKRMGRWRLDQYEDTLSTPYQWMERICTPVLVSPVFAFSRFPSRRETGRHMVRARVRL